MNPLPITHKGEIPGFWHTCFYLFIMFFLTKYIKVIPKYLVIPPKLLYYEFPKLQNYHDRLK